MGLRQRLEYGQSIANLVAASLPPGCIIGRSINTEWLVKFKGEFVGGFRWDDGWYWLGTDAETLTRFRLQVTTVRSIVRWAMAEKRESGRKAA